MLLTLACMSANFLLRIVCQSRRINKQAVSDSLVFCRVCVWIMMLSPVFCVACKLDCEREFFLGWQDNGPFVSMRFFPCYWCAKLPCFSEVFLCCHGSTEHDIADHARFGLPFGAGNFCFLHCILSVSIWCKGSRHPYRDNIAWCSFLVRGCCSCFGLVWSCLVVFQRANRIKIIFMFCKFFIKLFFLQL